MTRRIIRIVLSVLLIPALTGISIPCAPAGQTGSAGSYESGADTHCDASIATDASGDAQRQHSQRAHRNPAGTSCCPAIAGCGAVALQASVALLQPAGQIVASAHVSYADSPIALTPAPEPPPPKV